MRVRRVVILALALFAAVYLARGLARSAAAEPTPQAADEGGSSGIPGPSAVGVPVNPHQLPPGAAGSAPPEAQEVPRHYPVDQETFERLKAQANAAAATDATPEGETP